MKTIFQFTVFPLSDDLEIALELPVRHGFAELALFPLPRGREVIDERIAEAFACRLRSLEPLRGLPQGARQRELPRLGLGVRVAFHGLARLDLVLDAVEAGREARGERQVRIRVRSGD